MTGDEIDRLLRQVQAGELDLAEARQALLASGSGDDVVACIDHDREARCGFPEVIYGAGKTPAQIVAIMQEFREHGRNVLVTRLPEGAAEAALAVFPDAQVDALARTLTWLTEPLPVRPGLVGVVTAGTSDSPVALEAANTLRFLGYRPQVIQDIGVAGLHRLLSRHHQLRELQVIIVVAGMEGALPSVVGGLVSVPVIAVPTSVGYGAHLDGLTPLLAMVNSCASGITVTNINNGFGAACAAARILSLLGAPAEATPQRQQPMAGCCRA